MKAPANPHPERPGSKKVSALQAPSLGDMTTAHHQVRQRLSEREAAEYLGPVSVRTLQDWRNRGTGPAYTRLGRRIAYDVADLDAFLAAERVEPKTGAAS